MARETVGAQGQGRVDARRVRAAALRHTGARAPSVSVLGPQGRVRVRRGVLLRPPARPGGPGGSGGPGGGVTGQPGVAGDGGYWARKGNYTPRLTKKSESNKGKVGAFRRWLIDTFGADAMRAGSGVLDIVGGKGELSFELLNLNSVPTTVIDPRVVLLTKVVKKLRVGLYASSSLFHQYLDMDAHDRNREAPRRPDHLKLFFDQSLIDWMSSAHALSLGAPAWPQQPPARTAAPETASAGVTYSVLKNPGS